MDIVKVNHGKQRDGSYRREMKRTWFLGVPFYALYMLREATAIITLIYSIIFIFGLAALSKSKEAFVSWANVQSVGIVMWFAVLAFLLSLYHTATWFAAAPKAMDLRVDGKKVADHKIIALNWAVLLVLTLIALGLAGLK